MPASIDPFAVMTTAPPRVCPGSAAALAKRHFGIRGEFERLASERDLNYLVRERSGGRFVLKFSNSAEDVGVTDFQNAALRYLEHRRPGLPVPRLIRTMDGAGSARVEADDGRHHTLRLLSWLPGESLDRFEPTPDVARQLGATLASLGAALREFTHPAANHPLLWDIRQAGRLYPVVEHIGDRSLRGTCERRFQHFVDDVSPRLRHCRAQVVFNDLNWGNVLFDAASPDRVTGIIDFGDMVYSALVIDIAVGAAYLCRDDADPLADVRKFLRGYHAVTPIRDEEFDLLPDLMQMRNVMSITIAHWRASRYPENREYLMVSLSRAKSMLALLDAMPAADLAADLRAAAGGAPAA